MPISISEHFSSKARTCKPKPCHNANKQKKTDFNAKRQFPVIQVIYFGVNVKLMGNRTTYFSNNFGIVYEVRYSFFYAGVLCVSSTSFNVSLIRQPDFVKELRINKTEESWRQHFQELYNPQMSVDQSVLNGLPAGECYDKTRTYSRGTE